MPFLWLLNPDRPTSCRSVLFSPFFLISFLQKGGEDYFAFSPHRLASLQTPLQRSKRDLVQLFPDLPKMLSCGSRMDAGFRGTSCPNDLDIHAVDENVGRRGRRGRPGGAGAGG